MASYDLPLPFFHGMMARLLRWILALELSLACLLGWLFASVLNAPIVGYVSGFILVLAVQPTIIALDFLITRRTGGSVPPEFRLTTHQALCTYVREIIASMWGFGVAHPFLAHVHAPVPRQGSQSVALLFVHGYFCNRAIWLPWMREAAHRGFWCEAVTLEPVFGSIEDYPPVIETAVQRLLGAARCNQLIIVCHSMGGLAVRQWMRRFGDARVTRVIALGSPNAGTVMAPRWVRSPNLKQMCRESLWREALNASESAKSRAKITNIFSHHDNIVAPQSSSALAGTRTISIGGVGHVSLVYSKQVWAIVFAEIERACNATSQPETTSGRHGSNWRPLPDD